MSMQYIRDCYKVPAKRGGTIRFTNTRGAAQDGVIVGSDGQYLKVSFDGMRPVKLHPAWNVEYLDAAPVKDAA